MKRRLKEETILFMGVIKWVFLATIIGAIVGVSAAMFLRLLNWGVGVSATHKNYFLLLPIGLFLSVLLIKYLARDADGHGAEGTEKVIEDIHKHSGRIKIMAVPVKLIATIITICSGGSAGKEGPCAQIGGGLSSLFADIFKFGNSDRKKLVICGISAGFASVFGAPIAGSILGVEILFIGAILYDVLLPSFVAGIVSYHISSLLGVKYFYHTINFVPVFSEGFFLKVLLAGAFFGVCSILLTETLNFFNKLSKKLPVWAPIKGIIGGIILVVLTFTFSKQYLGLGLDTIQSSLSGEKTIWYAFIVKIIFTSITLSFGGCGGIVTPILFIGASSGTLFASIFGLDISTFAAIGFVCLLAGAANTPIAASIMAMEFFGTEIAPYAAAACVVSFLITGNRSVYSSQVLAVKKSSSLHDEIGKEIDEINAKTQPRNKSAMGLVRKIAKILRR